MPSRSTTDAIVLLQQLIEKYREKNSYIIFIDLEKANDKDPWKTDFMGSQL